MRWGTGRASRSGAALGGLTRVPDGREFQPRGAIKRKRPPRDTTSPERKRVLIVDDEMDFNYVMRLTLEGTGQYQVRTLSLPTQVVQVARDFRPHLILLDCMMPGVDGGEVAALLQKDPQLKDIPFAFLTATVSEPETATSRCYQGEQEYLPKTMRMEELVEYIERKTRGAPEVTPPPGDAQPDDAQPEHAAGHQA